MLALYDCMKSKKPSTLESIFTDPLSGTIAWAAIENLLVAVGCETIESIGSRVRFHKEGVIASFFRPHPAKETKRYQVRDAREFLTKLGVQP